MKFTKLLSCCIIAVMLTGCGKTEETSADILIDPPPLPDYSAYVSISEYKNVEYELKNNYSVTDDDVEHSFKDALSGAAEFAETKTAGAEKGDFIQFSYAYTITNETDKTSAKQIDIPLELGYIDDNIIEVWQDELTGLKKGETKTFSASYPKDFEDTDLAGQTAEFTVMMLSVINVTFPEITDDLVSKYTDYDTVENAKLDIRALLTENKQKLKSNEIYNTVIASIISSSDYKSYPDGEIDSLISTAVSAAEKNAALKNMTVDDYLKDSGQADTLDEFKTMMESQAKDYLNIRMTLSEIARLENITATAEEFTNYKTQFAYSNGFKSLQEVNLYYKDEDLLIDCIYPKIQEWIVDNSIEKR